MKSLIGKKGFLFVIGTLFCVVVVAYAADFDVTLPDTDGTSAFEVLDSGSTSLMRFGSDGGATIGDGGGTVAINSSDWDISTTGDMTGIGAVTADGIVNAKGFNDKLMKVSNSTFETAVVDTEYYSPNQHGGIYGVIYRQYWDGGALPTDLTDGTITVAKLVDYVINWNNSNDHVAHGYAGYNDNTDAYEVSISRNTGTSRLVMGATGWSLTNATGWVDYAK